MTKLRLAFFLPSLIGGGAEKVTLNLVKYLAKHYDFAIDIVLVSATGEFMDQVPDNVRIVDLNSSRMMASIPKLVMYLRRERPHAILSCMTHTSIAALISKKIARTKTRTVACLHINLTSQIIRPSVWRSKHLVPFIKLTHPWADVIVATSRGCGEDFLKITGVGKDNMTVIYNPTITDEILPLSKQAVDHHWYAEDQPPVILAVGRLVKQKNYELLINTFANLRKHRQANLVILGEGPLRDDLEQLVSELGIQDCVDMPGFVENPYAYMAKSAMLVMSSYFEALPAVLIEALHVGTQVVSVDCPNGPSEILENGRYGVLVPMDNVDALTEGMIKAIDNVDYRPAEEACECYQDKNVAPQYVNALLGSETTMQKEAVVLDFA